MPTICRLVVFPVIVFILQVFGGTLSGAPASAPRLNKIKDVVIYEDAKFFCAFPSVVKRPDGELLVAFRRAPNKMLFGEKRNTHIDPNSYLVTVRSRDAENWTAEPELLYAHSFGGSQDPCLLQLRDGTLLCASYGWAVAKPEPKPEPEGKSQKTAPPVPSKSFFLGGYILRSTDGGKTWQGPLYPPAAKSDTRRNPFGEPLPAYNRGAMLESANGKIYWAVAVNTGAGKPTSVHLMVSEDKGLNWQYCSEIAADEKATFNETSLYETPRGDIVAFLRTAKMDDHACIARSTDGGKTFRWESMEFQGHPLNALRLPDDRVLLTYGYRHKPHGIRARILNAECTDFVTAEEYVLRDDGGGWDIGYTWPVLLDNNRALVVYYFNKDDGLRHIAGTIVEIK